MLREIDRLRGEKPLVASIRNRQGCPRLYVNDKEIFPLLAWSWKLIPEIAHFKKAGISVFHPIFGLNSAWPEEQRYDWSVFDSFFAGVLSNHPDAFFLPRVLLDVPEWWKDKHSSELIKSVLPTTPEDTRMYRPVRFNEEGGWNWGIQFREPSLASEIWRSDMEKLLKAFLIHFRDSPLCSRIIGYQIGAGIYGEWHYNLSEFMPDTSQPMIRKIGYIPDLKERLHTAYGLFRDPVSESEVIDYYRKFHEEINAGSLLHFARIVKETTGNRVLCGAFYTYLLENVWIQEGGHLAPESILRSPDIDFVAAPYSYQTTNIEGRQWWEHDILDDAGNFLGRTRGVGGDAGYRVLLESVKRNGKLYFVEIDPGTFLEPQTPNPDGTGGTDVQKELCMIGGIGSTTPEGTMRILKRDIGRMFVSGNGGWLFDFGPVMGARKSWYADDAIVNQIKYFVEFADLRTGLDLGSCAEIAAVYDAHTFYYTRHWRAEAPYSKGAANMDYFSYNFLDSQARVFNRLGSPVDYLFRFDIRKEDFQRYKLLFMVNTFVFTGEEVRRMRSMLHNSGATVVWFYAPGFVNPERINLKQMEELTGMAFEILPGAGTMTAIWDPQARDAAKDSGLLFGRVKKQFPRFAVKGGDAGVLARWADGGGTACAIKKLDGWTSIYAGTAPIPVEILRSIVSESGAGIWSSAPDIVCCSNDAALLVATREGKRTFRLHKPMIRSSSGETSREFELELSLGEAELYLART